MEIIIDTVKNTKFNKSLDEQYEYGNQLVNQIENWTKQQPYCTLELYCTIDASHIHNNALH